MSWRQAGRRTNQPASDVSCERVQKCLTARCWGRSQVSVAPARVLGAQQPTGLHALGYAVRTVSAKATDRPSAAARAARAAFTASESTSMPTKAKRDRVHAPRAPPYPHRSKDRRRRPPVDNRTDQLRGLRHVLLPHVSRLRGRLTVECELSDGPKARTTSLPAVRELRVLAERVCVVAVARSTDDLGVTGTPVLHLADEFSDAPLPAVDDNELRIVVGVVLRTTCVPRERRRPPKRLARSSSPSMSLTPSARDVECSASDPRVTIGPSIAIPRPLPSPARAGGPPIAAVTEAIFAVVSGSAYVRGELRS